MRGTEKLSHPVATMSRMSYIDEVNEVIDRHGFSITYVGDTCACNADHCVPPNIPWGYTVGVLDRGFPELVMTGLQPIPTAELFHTVWDLVCASLLPRIGRDHAVVIDGVTVCFVPIPDSYWDETDLLLGAAEYHAHYGTPRRAVQMVVADNDGRFHGTTLSIRRFDRRNLSLPTCRRHVGPHTSRVR